MAELLDDNLVSVAILSDGQTGQIAPAAIVGWSVPPQLAGSLAQVYLDGQLSAASDDPGQCQLAVPLAIDPVRPAVRIQVVLVQPAEWSSDFASLLGPQANGGRALVRWPQTHAPLGTTVNVFANGGQGEIDWATPLNRSPIEWYPGGLGLWGFGLAEFGGAAFGFDINDQGPPGFGCGGFGIGEFGFDAGWAEWLSDPLAAGTYCLAVVASDELGNAGAASPAAMATIVPLPTMIGELTVAAGTSGGAMLSWQ